MAKDQHLTGLERDTKALSSLDTVTVSPQKADELVHSSGQGLSNLHLLSGRKVPTLEQTIAKEEATSNFQVESPRPTDSTPKYRNDLSPDKLGVVGFVTETVSMAKELISNRIQQRRASIEGIEEPAEKSDKREEHPAEPTPAEEPVLVQKVKSLFPKPLVQEDGAPRYKVDGSWGYKHNESNPAVEFSHLPSQSMEKHS
ncbi:hypothetical protein K493DRAFT_313016 [Basidiobolus meristosporus CBS 931.73]|uniref:Uncharacterized protein n=1 Tax=Basidiobolus meristosporus CBS 931.73 TaxID=1314790 RepID=A0A1Y1YQ21_9FUNG|nr:hypothetical protein K493DRAFT_313016 [Basidiobolus meristosporus CBS 931.73]|eukprot:ORX99923.1 hypothetical protein K493DRAFT_313016 [Basidiobolus meristosporus CBS 931.73]